MNKTAQSKSTTFSPPVLGKLQRSCACGNHSSGGGECAECAKKRMQKKLAIGAVNDPLEREADRVADQVLAASSQASLSSASSHIQRYASQANEEDTDTAPESVHQVLEDSGRPLEPVLNKDLGRRFGRDFSHVRVHTDAAASQSAKEVNAEAYTVGHKIVFAQGRFQPGTEGGRKLLAHELAHVVQQGGGKPHADSAGAVAMMPSLTSAVPMLRAKPDKKAGPAPKPAKPKIPQICGRNSRKVAGNSITKVTLDVGANTLKIEWSDPSKAPAASAGTHAISPGTGLCCVDCNDDKTSQTSGSLCTPKGGSWKVDHVGCALGGHPTAKNPTYFQRGGIAIHSGNTSSPPRSHGCSRTSMEISEIIHDNVVPEQTDIESNGTWTSTKCYKTEAAETPVNRSDVCDGFKLKSKKKAAPKKDTPKAKPKVDPKAVEPPSTPQPTPTQPPPVAQDQPVAEVLSDESDGLDNVAFGIIPDGPGPNNDPASHESLGEMPVSDLEPIDEGESNDKEGETALV